MLNTENSDAYTLRWRKQTAARRFAYLHMAPEGRDSPSAATLAAAGRDLNLWLWFLLFAWGALVGVVDRGPSLWFPLAAPFSSWLPHNIWVDILPTAP